jgi:hypothetical protein
MAFSPDVSIPRTPSVSHLRMGEVSAKTVERSARMKKCPRRTVAEASAPIRLSDGRSQVSVPRTPSASIDWDERELFYAQSGTFDRPRASAQRRPAGSFAPRKGMLRWKSSASAGTASRAALPNLGVADSKGCVCEM